MIMFLNLRQIWPFISLYEKKMTVVTLGIYYEVTV